MIKDCVWIDAEGSVILCIGAKQTFIGNIHQMSVAELLQSPTRLKIAEDHIGGKYDNGVCNKCEQWSSTYGKTEDNGDHTAFMSCDTQYYATKKVTDYAW